MFPMFKAFLDAFVQEIPTTRQMQIKYTPYSGKKKRHTVKTQLTINKKGLTIHKIHSVRESMYYYALYKLVLLSCQER